MRPTQRQVRKFSFSSRAKDDPTQWRLGFPTLINGIAEQCQNGVGIDRRIGEEERADMREPDASVGTDNDISRHQRTVNDPLKMQGCCRQRQLTRSNRNVPGDVEESAAN